MTIILALALGLIVGLVIGWDRGFRTGSANLESAREESWNRGRALGEKTARWHNRSFIRFEKYERLTPEQVMPGPWVEESP